MLGWGYETPMALRSVNEQAEARRDLLKATLLASVPLEIIHLQRQGGADESHWAWIEEFLDEGDRTELRAEQQRCAAAGIPIDLEAGLKGVAIYLGSYAEALIHPEPGLTAQVFPRLARAIAILSFHSEGLKFLGEHWRSSDYDQFRIDDEDGCD